MSKKSVIIIVVIVCLIVVFSVFTAKFFLDKQDSQNQEVAIIYNNANKDLIEVELPYPGAVTGKKFHVIGQARGFWFFEASFPIEILDKNKNLLATGIAQAQSNSDTSNEIDWMTENFVPFKAEIEIPESYIGPAILILKKDNPSGLSENDASVSLPIIVEY